MNQNKTFFQTLIHELNAPLNAVDGYLRLMHEKQAGNDIEAYFEMLERSIIRIEEMKQLVSKLLEYSISKHTETNISEFDLVELVHNAIETVQQLLNQKNIQIFIHPNKKVNLSADMSDFEIILNNLISNAAKYNCLKGTINIYIDFSNNSLNIKIIDTGIGMSDEEKAIVFDEFVRIRNKNTKEIAGHGLGLSIVKNIVNSYNGSIELQSIQYKGTTVIVSLPWPLKKEK